jgi:acylphosphatase
MIKHFDITISGKVQGVFFRATSKEKADRMLVVGLARNEPNGDVYIEAEGTNDQLAHFLEWCNIGPDQARVDRVLVEESNVKGFSGFEIQR